MIYQTLPDYRVLVSVLLGATSRVNDRGAVCLTDREAAQLRQAGFMQAMEAGWYPCPPVPIDLLRPHAELARFAELWHGPRAVAAQPPQPTGASTASRFGLDPAKRERLFVHTALGDPDQRRVLASMVRHADGRITKRTLQQRLHRLPAARLNRALTRLVNMQLITRDGNCLLLPLTVRNILIEAGFRVNRRVRARSMRRSERQRHQERDASRSAQPRRRYQRRPIPNRRKDPHGWAMAMLGRLGGLRAQQGYRARGVHPTAKATKERKVKRQQRTQWSTAMPAAPPLAVASTNRVRTGADVHVCPPRRAR